MNVKIRKAVVTDASAITTIGVKTWQTAYKGIIPQAYLNSLSINDRIPKWAQRISNMKENKKEFFVAEIHNQKGIEIVGFSMSGPSHFEDFKIDGDLHAIYVLPKYWKQGIGTLLFNSVIKSFLKKNFKTMIIWALKENSAGNFYKKLGGIPKFHKTLTYGGKELEVLGFYWENLPAQFNF
ncbi:MAG: GNAT family N-acetyltransferase [Promethearchaeota archaeon]